MAGKLMKHEALRTRGLLGALFGGAAVLVALGALLAYTQWPLLSGVGLAVAAGCSLGFVPTVQLLLGVDYWRSSYRDFGYFTQTLPVKGSTIYGAKLAWIMIVSLAALLWAVALGLVTWLGVTAPQGGTLGDIFRLIGDLLSATVGLVPTWVWVAAPLLLLLFLCFGPLQLLFSASVGSEQRLRNLGLGGPIIVWFITYLALQLLFLTSIVAVPFGLGMVDGQLKFVSLNFLELMRANSPSDVAPIGFVFGYLLAAPVLIWRTAWSWNRKVHLS